MSNQHDLNQHVSLGDDEPAMVSAGLLTRRTETVIDLTESSDAEEPVDRRDQHDLATAVRNSVFGRPEPIAPSVGARWGALAKGATGEWRQQLGTQYADRHRKARW